MIVSHYHIANKIANQFDLPVDVVTFLIKFQCKVAYANLKARGRVSYFRFVYLRTFSQSIYWKEFMKLNNLYEQDWRYELRYKYYWNFNHSQRDEEDYYNSITSAIRDMGLSIEDFTYPEKTISEGERKLRDKKAKRIAKIRNS